MAEKKFILAENQLIWDTYYNTLLAEWETERAPKLKRQEYFPEKELECLKKLAAYNKKSITPYEFEFIRKKQSIQQYKPIVVSFEAYAKKSFNEISVYDLETFQTHTTKKNRRAHLNAFFLECVSRKIITTSNVDFMIYLLPDLYQNLGKIIAETS